MAHGKGSDSLRGFTIVELLVVILIIGVVVALVFPAITGSQRAAKKVATTAMLADLSSAASAFSIDNKRTPGYFTTADMGDQANVDRGFTGMNNVLLDLAGGIVAAGGGGPGAGDIVVVGPTAAKTVTVDVGRIGATGGNQKAYYSPPAKNWVVNGLVAQKQTNVADHSKLPDLVDSFGDPILAWSEDSTAGNSNFSSKARIAGTPGSYARFYWAENAAFLQATNLGRLGKTQAYTAANTPSSLLGGGRSDVDLATSLAGLLGNPAFPESTAAGVAPKPAAARGGLVFHSAGADGFYVGTTDDGGKFAASNAGPFTPNTLAYNNPVATQAGQAQVDAMSRFDDIIFKGDGSGG
ncbi:MAG: prepilin-type N-terminal cleavage/methylation domain-containing protein [Phycisphaeraceae bacterium]|nr:prepilin-type N-terminal cleavage/methylation domain-containing protein [Phycisphaeraceae bacterium]